MDTHSCMEQGGTAHWLAQIEKEYPDYNIVGECWYADPANTAYWQKDSRINPNGNTNLKSVMDFPSMLLARNAFNSETTRLTGLNEVYNRLSLDYLYENPQNVLTFLENHDTDRFLLEEPKDLGSWKQAVAWMPTTRGIPQMYYGQELCRVGLKKKDEGSMRLEMSGVVPGE